MSLAIVPLPSENSSPPVSEDWRNGGFGLYVHWPFCQAKCPYCDFNSHVVSGVDQTRWARALVSEIDRYAALTPERRLSSIFFGGGTPSLMEPATVEAVIAAAQRQWNFSNDIEITLEANPTSVEADRFVGYRAAGVNRVSMGIQSLDDTSLRALGRLHTAAEALAAFDVARSTFDRVSFDLIYARQHQSAREWEAELRRALSFDLDHLSVYQLTIEPNTAFGDRFSRNRLPGLPDEDLGADMWVITQDLCLSAGLPAYEVSNHARPGSESRHNQIYWRYGDYVGVGPGAHGRVTTTARTATAAVTQPGKWLADVEAGVAPDTTELLSPQEQAEEYLLMGLRLSEGISLNRIGSLNPQALNQTALSDLLANGFLEECDGQLRTTAAGRPLLNAILARLAASP
ncbi:coproporphyrinogen III oxidase [Mesobaculum littorinae]|uniref:Heme chaperone HemW n=1 Tax=Mesobaculum littorinae TaxID=2486419 RepID=A0A438AH26_9RHOB|nr:radical SAM family heme chaperone HemW [Mesobaculum littorinae]RVV98023.1 coproporphyrinogen III oxidase [Mesobaculum littorinae]